MRILKEDLDGADPVYGSAYWYDSNDRNYVIYQPQGAVDYFPGIRITDIEAGAGESAFRRPTDRLWYDRVLPPEALRTAPNGKQYITFPIVRS